MKEPLISIIVPIYNAEKYLRKCLDSILAQTYPNWEAICIDDGSSDNSSEILKEYAKKDLRILAIPQKARGGVSAARNAGLDAAQGDYVYFMDADDYVSPYFFEKNLTASVATMPKPGITTLLFPGRSIRH